MKIVCKWCGEERNSIGQADDVCPSMGSPGDYYANTLCESFFATLECELLDRRRFKTQAEARMATFEFLEGLYNPHHRYSGAVNLSPYGTGRTPEGCV